MSTNGSNGAKRVLYSNSWSSCHGGSSTSLIDIVTHLDPKRYHPTVLCPEPGELPDRLREQDVDIRIRRNAKLSKTAVMPFAVDVCRMSRMLRRERIQLVHANVGGTRSSLAMASRLCGVPYIQHVRNPLGNQAWKRFGFRWAARIITNSDTVASPLREDTVAYAKTVTVYNAVDFDAYDDSPTDHRQELGAGNRPIIGYVGQIVPRKDVLNLLKAMVHIVQVLPDALLVIVGCPQPGKENYLDECHRFVSESDLGNHVRFMGYRRDVPEWMRTFDVFALPTLEEPFGKVVIEAMAGRCPVVATEVGGIPEIIASEELGTLISPGDSSALAAALLHYLSSPMLRRAVAERAIRYARETFSMNAMLSHLQSVYDTILKERAAGKLRATVA